MRPVQCLHSFAIDAAGNDALLLPNGLALLRRPDNGDDLAPLLPELANIQIGQFVGDLLWGPSLNGDIVISGHLSQFGHVADHIPLGLAVGDGLQRKGHIPSVVGVGRRTCGDGPDQVAGLDGVNGRPANPSLTIFSQTAGAHAA